MFLLVLSVFKRYDNGLQNITPNIGFSKVSTTKQQTAKKGAMHSRDLHKWAHLFRALPRD
jgi:hypothetical protein